MKINILCFLSIWFLGINNLIAQTKYYQTSITWESSNIINGFEIIEQPNNNYIIGGTAKNIALNRWIAYSVQTNQYGALVDTNEYLIDTTLFHGCNINDVLPTDYGYIIAGFINNSTTSLSSVYLVRIDHQGNLIDQTTLTPPLSGNYTNIGYGICSTPDGGYLVGGSSGTQGWSTPYLCKLNANLVIEWDTLYEQYANIYSRLSEIKPAKDGNGYWAIANINTTYEEGDIALLRINNTGIIEEEYIYGENTGNQEGVTSFIETLDNGHAISLYSISNNFYKGGMLKTDNVHGIEWGRVNFFKGGGPGRGITQLPDSSFIVSGTYFKDTPPYDGDVEINKFSNSGEWLWTRHYGNEGNDYIYDMILDSQGSLVFCGRDEPVNLPDVVNGANLYLLKTNCMGLLTQPQANFTAQIDTAALTASFYNLSQFVYPDSIDGGHYLWDFGDGTTSTDINPTHTYTQGGNYTVTLTAVVCSDTSVYTLPVSTYAVGINQVLPLEGGLEGGLCTVLPNPANEQISISPPSGGWGVQTHTFVLYDVLAREVLRQHLSSNNTIVTEHLPAGVYLYQIINPQKQTLQHGKISIMH
jgi:hypothetical protein